MLASRTKADSAGIGGQNRFETPFPAADAGRAVQLHRIRAAIARVEKNAPVEVVQEKTIAELEDGFYRHLAHVEEAALSPASMQILCEECCALVTTRLQEVRKTEADFYYDLPRYHEIYQKLLDFESSLESEAVAWKIILELSNLRSGETERDGSLAEVESEHAFVEQWLQQQSALLEIQAVVKVLEHSYDSIHPPELSEAASLLQNPIPARAFLDHEINTLKIRPEESKPSRSDESVFELIFRALRAGDEKFAEEVALKAGLVHFVTNFKLRLYSKTKKRSKKVPGASNRLRWKEIALTSLKNENMGPWQRAVRGILCGNCEAALPVAETWEDEAWIYFKCFFDTAIEKAIAEWRGNVGGGGLPAVIWQTSSGMRDIFDQISKSRNEKIRRAAINIFPLSIRAALVNDLEDALVEIENYILATSVLYPIHMNEVQIPQQNLESGSGVRFSLHVLLLMRRVGIQVNAVLFGRACFLYAKTTTSRNPDLWACYLAKIPDDQRYDAILYFFSHHLSKPEEKVAFLSAMAVRDEDNSVAVMKAFVNERIFSNELALAPLDMDVFVGLFECVGRLGYGIADWLLSASNFVIRRFLLPDDIDVDTANDFFLMAKPAVDRFLLEPGVLSVDGQSAKTEFICWTRYFEMCDKFSEWTSATGTGATYDPATRSMSKTAAILVGYDIICMVDWLAPDRSTAAQDIDLDRDQQLAHLRGKTLGQVFTSLIEILQYCEERADEKAEIEQLNTALELSENIAKNFSERIGDVTFVEDSFEKIQREANRISLDPAYAHLLTRKLKDKIYQFEQSYKRLRFRLSSDETLAGI